MCSLRRILIFGLLAWIAIPSEAAKRLTVAQLEKMLAADLAAQKQDSEVASQLAGISLAERIPRTTFARLITQTRPNSQTSLALTILANQSEFLEPPATELVADPAPDNPAQARMLQSARQYVSQTLRGLPNFLATRTINLYDDRPQPVEAGRLGRPAPDCIWWALRMRRSPFPVKETISPRPRVRQYGNPNSALYQGENSAPLSA